MSIELVNIRAKQLSQNIPKISCNILQGSLCLLKGSNGSGKTSLLRVLALLNPYEGRLFFKGNELSLSDIDYLAQLFYFSHEPGLYLNLTCQDNMRLWLARRKLLHAYDRVHYSWQDWSDKLDLTRYWRHKIFSLSRGQKQKMTWLLLLASGAKIWLLDEAMSNLDCTAEKKLSALCYDHCLAGGTVILATHQPVESWSWVNKISIIEL